MSQRFDTLILGQGLAGSALAWQLIEAGQRVCVVDDGHLSASSRVAAGLINPLAGMRFNRRPQLDDWLGASDRWYSDLQHRLQRRFLHACPMLRLFRSPEQQRFYDRIAEDTANRDLLGERFDRDLCPGPVSAPYGGFVQHRTGYVDMPQLLQQLRRWLTQHGALHEYALDYREIEPAADGVAAAGLRADRLVFCDGARVRLNPWFDWLPLAPDKGEILNLQIADRQLRYIVNAAHWLVPVANGEIRLGATHDHQSIDDRPSWGGRQVLLRGLEQLLPGAQSRVVAHKAGLRPATQDRYPLLGRHPQFPCLWVCNGFGARGALTIPWYTQCLAEHLVRASPLPVEADIRRCK
jgi:glycine/D-amino acid oxidase-like deaminating enzyme